MVYMTNVESMCNMQINKSIAALGLSWKMLQDL